MLQKVVIKACVEGQVLKGESKTDGDPSFTASESVIVSPQWIWSHFAG